VKITRKRLAAAAGGVATVGAAATLIAGTTFGLFSAQAPSGNSTFSSGSVSVSNDAASVPCPITNAVPGDNSGASPCTFKIANASTVPSYAAVDVFIATGKAATVPQTYGSTATVTPKDLYDGTNTTGLTFTITDGSANSFTVPVGPGNAVSCAGLAATDPFKAASTALSSPSADSCYVIKNLLLSTSAVPAATTTISTLSAAWSIPAAAGNAYQGADALLQFNAHSVQSGNNTLNCTTTATVGAACAPNGTFSWS
jgi:hypothetical protein